MILQVSVAALWIAETIHNSGGNYGIFHCLLNLRFQIFGGMSVIANCRGDIYQFL